MRFANPGRRSLFVLLASLLLQGALAFFAGRAYLASRNTLEENGRWRTTKTELARGVNGAFNYLTGVQALSRGRLNLAAWHGFNEVLSAREANRPRTLAFDFGLREGSYLVVLFDRDASGRGAGLRLSASRRFPNTLLEIAPDGEFLSRQPLRKRRLAKDSTHHADLRLAAGLVSVVVDGRPLGTFERTWQAGPRFGFRGGLLDAWVDNVEVTLADGTRLSEDFEPAARAGFQLALLLAVAAVHVGIYAALRRIYGPADSSLPFRFLVTNVSLLAFAVIVWTFVLHRTDEYPGLDDDIRHAEAYYELGAMGQTIDEIRARYREEPPDDESRLLFVGSSQTWGAGALHDSQTITSVTEALLDSRRPGGRPVEVINAGVSAARAAVLEPLLAAEWLRLRPDAVVINLASNDRHSWAIDGFAWVIERMVVASLEAGACPLLVLEANAFGALDRALATRHRELRAIGREAGVPVVDMHARLRRFEDRGFLWWDRVHLTAYGQRIVAETIAGELEGVLHEPPVPQGFRVSTPRVTAAGP